MEEKIMPQDNQPQKIKIQDWTFRIKRPSTINDPAKILLLLHGYMGNENVMWIFTNPLPDSFIFIAPRAPLKLSRGKYSWHEIQPQWPTLDSYKNLSKEILGRVVSWLSGIDVGYESIDVMGFSQGGVVAYSLAFLYPEKIDKVATLASFIPQSWKSSIKPNVIQNKEFFIAHGTEDALVPLNKAIASAKWLEENGAAVTFCQANTGHKLGAECFKALGNFFTLD
jgi:phospholipase/carboxylesterase